MQGGHGRRCPSGGGAFEGSNDTARRAPARPVRSRGRPDCRPGRPPDPPLRTVADRVHPSRRPAPAGPAWPPRCPMTAAMKPATITAPKPRAMLLAAFALLLGGCALAPTSPPSAKLFNDDAFPAPSERPDAAQVFALNDAMRAYLRTEIAASVREQGQRRGLIAGLYRNGGPQARVRLGDDPQRRAGVRGPDRQLPVAGDHDRRLRQGDGPAGAIPGSGRRHDLQPQRQTSSTRSAT